MRRLHTCKKVLEINVIDSIDELFAAKRLHRFSVKEAYNHGFAILTHMPRIKKGRTSRLIVFPLVNCPQHHKIQRF
jgi:hypothetical protein